MTSAQIKQLEGLLGVQARRRSRQVRRRAR
jgi:hypothetical protein